MLCYHLIFYLIIEKVNLIYYKFFKNILLLNGGRFVIVVEMNSLKTKNSKVKKRKKIKREDIFESVPFYNREG